MIHFVNVSYCLSDWVLLCTGKVSVTFEQKEQNSFCFLCSLFAQKLPAVCNCVAGSSVLFHGSWIIFWNQVRNIKLLWNWMVIGNSMILSLLLFPYYYLLTVSSVQFSCSVVSDSMRPHELQYTRPPCPSPTPRVHLNSHPSSWWCHPAISSSVVPFSSCPQSLPASESFPMSQLFAWGGQSTVVSALASVLPMYIQVDFP